MIRNVSRWAGTWIAAILASGCGGAGGGTGTVPVVPPTTQYVEVEVAANGIFGSGLILRNNGGDALTVSSDASYKFSNLVAVGDTYDVTVYTQPKGPAENCTVANGSGTASIGVAINVVVNCVLIVSGTYAGVEYGHSGDRASLGVTVLDDAGSYTTTSDENAAGSIGTGIVNAGIYSVDTSGAISMDSKLIASSTDDEAIIATDLSPGDLAYLNFGVKIGPVGSGKSALIGRYILATYDKSGTAAALYTINADGAGSFDGSASFNDGGTIPPDVNVTGSYAVATDGQLAIGPFGGISLRGYLSENGELQVLSQLNAGELPSFTVGIKVGTGPYSVGVAAGNYVIVTMEKGADSAVQHKLTFDGAGHVSGTVTRNDSGVITDLNQQKTPLTEQGTYSVEADGKLTLVLDGESPLTGAVTADGEYLVLVDLNAGHMARIGVGLRSYSGPSPWDY